LRRGALVLVGGQSRGVGKTLLIEKWLGARRDRWIAVKVSAHRHAADGMDVPLVEEAAHATAATQSGRYLAAGAVRAFLVRAQMAALPAAAAFIESLRDGGANVIIESNRLVPHLEPQLLFFVADSSIQDWKDSSAACLRAPHVIVCRHREGVIVPSHRTAQAMSASR
jgi:hypothetical protein